MNNSIVDLRDFAKRLEKLECENRWLRRIFFAVLTAIGAILLMAQTAPTGRVIEAERFILTDVHGKPLAALAVSARPSPPESANAKRVEAAAALTFYDSEQRQVGRLESDKLLFFDKTGGERVRLEYVRALDIGPGANAALTLFDSTGHASVIVGDAGGPSVTLEDADGGRAELGVAATTISMRDLIQSFREKNPTENLSDAQIAKALRDVASQSGLVEIRPGEFHTKTSAASLVLFRGQTPVWRAP